MIQGLFPIVTKTNIESETSIIKKSQSQDKPDFDSHLTVTYFLSSSLTSSNSASTTSSSLFLPASPPC